MPSFLLALYTPASLLHLIVKSSKAKVNKFLNILYVNGLYPVPDNLLEIKNFRADSFLQVPCFRCRWKDREDPRETVWEFKWYTPGASSPSPRAWEGSSPAASPRSPHTDGLTDLSPGTSPTLIFLHVVFQKAAEDVRAAAPREGGFGNVFRSTGGWPTFPLCEREKTDRTWMRARVHRWQGQKPATTIFICG